MCCSAVRIFCLLVLNKPCSNQRCQMIKSGKLFAASVCHYWKINTYLLWKQFSRTHTHTHTSVHNGGVKWYNCMLLLITIWKRNVFASHLEDNLIEDKEEVLKCWHHQFICIQQNGVFYTLPALVWVLQVQKFITWFVCNKFRKRKSKMWNFENFLNPERICFWMPPFLEHVYLKIVHHWTACSKFRFFKN